MKLIILPLTYKGKEKKRQAVKEAVELAKQIVDKEEKTFVLSGILVFADKIIDFMHRAVKCLAKNIAKVVD